MAHALTKLAATAITAILAMACTVEEPAPASAPTSIARSVTNEAATATPSPIVPRAIPTIGGVFTSDDLRQSLAAYGDENRIVVDQDVQVIIPPAWYESAAEWTGAGFIYHIPSMSVITLDYEANVKREDIKSDAARERLDQVLGDAPVMREVRLRIVGRTYEPDWPVF